MAFNAVWDRDFLAGLKTGDLISGGVCEEGRAASDAIRAGGSITRVAEGVTLLA